MPVLQSFTNGSNVFEANKIKMIANPNFKQQIYYFYIYIYICFRIPPKQVEMNFMNYPL